VSFAAITLCVASQRVFIVVSVYFVIDSVRKLLDTPSYIVLAVFLYMNYYVNSELLNNCMQLGISLFKEVRQS
jgi:hypothetical protein